MFFTRNPPQNLALFFLQKYVGNGLKIDSLKPPQWSQVRFHPNSLALEKFQLPMIVRSIPYLKQLKTKSHNEGFQRKSNFRFLLYEEILKI